MLKAIKIRLYPTLEQKTILNKHFGATRFVYNRALNFKVTEYERDKTKYSKFDMIKWVTEFRKSEEFPWLQEIKCETIQNQIDGLDTAFTKFFKGSGFPKFKKKSNNQSFTSKQAIKILENSNKIVFFSHKIKFKTSKEYALELRLPTTKIKKVTYSKDNCNHYYASILVEVPDFNEDRTNITKEIGIDLGLKEFLVTSDGFKVENPRFLRNSLNKIKKLQRKHSRKKKGSANRERSRIKLAKAYKKVTNQRKHFMHCVTNELINENQVISLETLKVKNMIKNHKLALSIADVSWSSFTSILEYKAFNRGAEIRRIDTFLPSSKKCSCCGQIKEDLTLADRTYVCVNCGLIIDRDQNAAINILDYSKDVKNLKLK